MANIFINALIYKCYMGPDKVSKVAKRKAIGKEV